VGHKLSKVEKHCFNALLSKVAVAVGKHLAQDSLAILQITSSALHFVVEHKE